MPSTLNDAEERQIVEAAKTAVDLVEGGMSPDAAVEKVARDSGFGPGKIRLVGHAYNTGRQLAQWNSGGNVLDKLAEYPLCDPEAVVQAVHNAPATKTASDRISDEYSRAPHWAGPAREKKASYELPKPQCPPLGVATQSIVKAYGAIQREKQAADEARRKASAAEADVRSKVANQIGYFKQASHGRLSFEVVESAARSYYGDAGANLLGVVYAQGRLREKRASDTPPLLKSPLNLRAEPFTLIKAAIDAAAVCRQLRVASDAGREKLASAKVEALRPFENAGAAQPQADPGPWSKEAAAIFGTEKQAFGFGTEVAAIALGDIAAHKATHQPTEDDPYGDVTDMNTQIDEIRRQAQLAAQARTKRAFLSAPAVGAAMGTMFGRTVGSIPKTKDDMVEDAWMDLEDPEHANALRKIRSHAMLNQLMTDPEEPISAHDPDKVLSAFNEISQATPRLAENIATLRPHLRKRLESHTEPFEAKELLDTEKAIQATRAPTPNTSILSETPEKMLG